MLALVHFIYAILSFLQSQEHKSCCTLQIKGLFGQSSVSAVATDKCLGKSNKRLSVWASAPNNLPNAELFSG